MSRRVWLFATELDQIVARDRPNVDGLYVGSAFRVGDRWRVCVGRTAVTTRTRWGARRRLRGLSAQLLLDESHRAVTRGMVDQYAWWQPS